MRRSFGWSSSPRNAAPASRTEPIDVDLLFDEPTVALRGPVEPGDLVKIGPAAEDLADRYEYHLDFPGHALDPGLRLRALGAAPARGEPRRRSMHTSRPTRPPGQARPAVLALLHLQRLEQPARGRLGDDPARLRREDAARGADGGARVGRLQPARGRRAGRLGRREARARRRTPAGRLPGRRLARELLRRGALRRQLRPSRASAATTRAGRTSSSTRRSHDPERPGSGASRVPVDRVRGPLGRAPGRLLQRPHRPEPEAPVDRADRAGPRAGGRGATPCPRAASSGRARPTSSARGRRRAPRARSGWLHEPAADAARRSPPSSRSRFFAVAARPGARSRRFGSRAAARGVRSSSAAGRMYVERPRALPRHRAPVHPAHRRHLDPPSARLRRLRPARGRCRRARRPERSCCSWSRSGRR